MKSESCGFIIVLVSSVTSQLCCGNKPPNTSFFKKRKKENQSFHFCSYLGRVVNCPQLCIRQQSVTDLPSLSSPFRFQGVFCFVLFCFLHKEMGKCPLMKIFFNLYDLQLFLHKLTFYSFVADLSLFQSLCSFSFSVSKLSSHLPSVQKDIPDSKSQH